jgi:hypothetical protein
MARGKKQPRLPAGKRLSPRPRPAALVAGALLFAALFLCPATQPVLAQPVLDDATLQREYRDYRTSVEGLRLYHVGYIRVADETLARDLIARIRSGARFEEMAREHSIHAESAAQGGDLGTHAGCRWAKATLEMLAGLKPGQTWPQPVKGTHGWGIYRLVSVADVVPRSFEEYKSELLSGTFEPECPWEPPVTIRAAPAPGQGQNR